MKTTQIPVTDDSSDDSEYSDTDDLVRNSISDTDDYLNTRGPVSCIFSVAWLAGDVKEPTHLSKRVGDVVPGVVVYLYMYGSGG